MPLCQIDHLPLRFLEHSTVVWLHCTKPTPFVPYMVPSMPRCHIHNWWVLFAEPTLLPGTDSYAMLSVIAPQMQRKPSSVVSQPSDCRRGFEQGLQVLWEVVPLSDQRECH